MPQNPTPRRRVAPAVAFGAALTGTDTPIAATDVGPLGDPDAAVVHGHGGGPVESLVPELPFTAGGED